jgi:hypothetical protein
MLKSALLFGLGMIANPIAKSAVIPPFPVTITIQNVVPFNVDPAAVAVFLPADCKLAG